MPGWISVNDELPKPFVPVIVARVYEPGGPLRVEQGHKDVLDWWKVYGTRTKQVLYWMPFPDPPEVPV